MTHTSNSGQEQIKLKSDIPLVATERKLLATCYYIKNLNHICRKPTNAAVTSCGSHSLTGLEFFYISKQMALIEVKINA